MDNNERKGARVSKGESSLKALQEAMPHWIHAKKEDPSSVTGFLYERNCTCSVCGYEASFEKPKCPRCGAVMKSMKGI